MTYCEQKEFWYKDAHEMAERFIKYWPHEDAGVWDQTSGPLLYWSGCIPEFKTYLEKVLWKKGRSRRYDKEHAVEMEEITAKALQAVEDYIVAKMRYPFPLFAYIRYIKDDWSGALEERMGIDPYRCEQISLFDD